MTGDQAQAFSEYLWVDESIPIMCHEDYVARIAQKLSGVTGLSGLDGEQLKGWLLRHRVYSDALCEEMGEWAQWLSTNLPPYAAYHALNAARGLAAGKTPGVRPLACDEIFLRLMQACNRAQAKSSVKVNCRAKQLRTGLECGVEGSILAMRKVWYEVDGWVPSVEEMGILDDTRAVHKVGEYRPADPVAIASDSTCSREKEKTGFGTMFVDAKNAFNKPSRYVMLWHCCHVWPRASRFAFNWYWHSNIIIFRNGPHDDPSIIVIVSQEGIPHGDVFGLNLYGIIFTPYANA